MKFTFLYFDEKLVLEKMLEFPPMCWTCSVSEWENVSHIIKIYKHKFV